MVVAIIFLATGMMLEGCGLSDERPEFLTAHEWVHYGSASNETISFGEDGHFAFYGDEGNPVGNSDLYDRYSYDSESKAIKLKPEGDMKIKVLRHEKSRLLLDIDGDVKEFFDGKDERIAEALLRIWSTIWTTLQAASVRIWRLSARMDLKSLPRRQIMTEMIRSLRNMNFLKNWRIMRRSIPGCTMWMSRGWMSNRTAGR